jgi:hypothetical protein
MHAILYKCVEICDYSLEKIIFIETLFNSKV